MTTKLAHNTNHQSLTKAQLNAQSLEQELKWFERMVNSRLDHYFKKPGAELWNVSAPGLDDHESMYASFVRYYKLSAAERLVLVLALLPHIRPQMLDVFFRKREGSERGTTEFGGLKGQTHGGFLPTGETALFVLAGDSLEQRFHLQKIFDRDQVFARHNILSLEPAPAGEPWLSGALQLSRDYIDYFTTAEIHKPDFSINFPARLLTTQLEWSDLVLENRVLKDIEELRTWLQHGETLMKEWDLGKKLRPGYRALFYGPPGTGKTMTASLLGKTTGRDVYRIDLSTVVSKYIGETEKNLSKIFDQAQSKGWILFFDEADALFGKRTKVEDAHDKYANQEVSYLLQRIEDFDGIIILASNMKSNLDEAFTRRFESIIQFPVPQARERLRLWREGFSKKSKLEDSPGLKAIADAHEMSGGAIMNVIRYCSLKSLDRNSNIIYAADIHEGIRKEFQKEGKTL